MVEFFQFEWPVDQDGYTTERGVGRDADGFSYDGGFERLNPCGGSPRFYRPLDDGGLWLRFAETCRKRDGVLRFAGDFGMLRHQGDSVGHYLRLANRLRAIHERLSARDRRSAAAIFNERSVPFWWPTMYGTILQSSDRPEAFEWALIPNFLEDVLKLQAAEAITGNRQFRRCRNQECANWFRLGPRAATEGPRQTFTARREFCSDRCRVAHARRQRREATARA